MRIKTLLLIIGLLGLMSNPLQAGVNELVVEQQWSRASVGMARPGVAYMTIRNQGDNVMTLTSLTTDIAMMAHIHQITTDDKGVSHMSAAGDLEIAPGAEVSLKPGGLHIMLMHLQRPLIKGETYLLTLIFANGEQMTIEVPILDLSARGLKD